MLTTVTCPVCEQEHDLAMPAQATQRLEACTACLNPYLLQSNGAAMAYTVAMERFGNIREEVKGDAFSEALLRNSRAILRNLPVFPAVPQKALGQLHDPLSSLQDVAETINQDPALAIRVLRLANSACFAGVVESKTVVQACTRLGAKRVSGLLTSVASQGAFRCGDPTLRGVVIRHWEHACATAVCAQRLEELVEDSKSELMFMAGLLHDVGSLVILNLLVTGKIQGMDRLRTDPVALEKILNRFHALIGLHVVTHWGLSPELRVSTLFHDTLDGLPSDEHLKMTAAVALASGMARELGFSPDSQVMNERTTEAAEILGIGEARMTEIRAALTQDLPSVMQAMAMD